MVPRVPVVRVVICTAQIQLDDYFIRCDVTRLDGHKPRNCRGMSSAESGRAHKITLFVLKLLAICSSLEPKRSARTRCSWAYSKLERMRFAAVFIANGVDAAVALLLCRRFLTSSLLNQHR
ncbi:hypothetical protein GN244_ATG15868 [Phytophthora infestans]|uniref:Uncharacterized protein n=1 Tax=Phytophthora infestans TaxID=4787 RepID=A0A833W804_PHYIN|nr:hypothetical protein GN244_ATG15868 [Phytophthora infestans]